jgi:hypothetical protein
MTPKVAARAVAMAYMRHERAAPPDKLWTAIAVGDKLIELKAMCRAGTYEAVVWTTGVPLSTARLYARLARHTEMIADAGATSISDASTLLTFSPDGSTVRPGTGSVDRSEEKSTTLVAVAKALGTAILETAAIESAVNGTDFADLVEAYVARAVELSAGTASG